MHAPTPLEQALLYHLRQLPPRQAARSPQLRRISAAKSLSVTPAAPQPSFQQLASLPLSQRHQALAPFIANTAADFKTDPALTEFATLDSEDWEFPDDEP